ncbi:hypothetical protein V2J09_002189 [Rumex salicifolius]
MSRAAGPALPSVRSSLMVPAMIPSEIAAKDDVISWYRGEFAAANAIIDALCSHITQLTFGGGGASEYEAAFAAIHRRRINWIPVLQKQKYFSIADVALELRKVAAAKKFSVEKMVAADEKSGEKAEDRDSLKKEVKDVVQQEEGSKSDGNVGFTESVDDDSPHSEVTDTGSQEMQINVEYREMCDNHEECGSRRELIKLTKGFIAKEPMRGHMAKRLRIEGVQMLVNVVKSLKMYEDIFTDGEMWRLNDFVKELRVAGQNGELSGETYVLFNKEVKGSKREQVHLGAPIFGHIQDEAASRKQKTTIEPIPALLLSVIDHLAQWHIIPEARRPNGSIINYFDEGEYSQPFLKPPHLDQVICVLLLSESTLAFGRTLANDGEGNFKGSLTLPIKQGSVLVMRNKSADLARHAMCSSPSKRVSITFYRVHISSQANAFPPLTPAMTQWQPGNPMPRGFIPPMNPRWGLIHAPVLTCSPLSPVMVSPIRKVPRGGTGVFLPCGPKQRKPKKQYPPRARKGRFFGLPAVDAHAFETMSDPGYETRVV